MRKLQLWIGVIEIPIIRNLPSYIGQCLTTTKTGFQMKSRIDSYLDWFKGLAVRQQIDTAALVGTHMPGGIEQILDSDTTKIHEEFVA